MARMRPCLVIQGALCHASVDERKSDDPRSVVYNHLPCMCFRNSLLLALLWFLPPAACFGQVEELLSRGLQFMNKGDYARALSAFDEAKQAAPDDPRPYFFAGLTLYQTNQRLQALAELEKAVQRDPAEPRYALTYAEFLYKTGDHYRAAATLEPFKGAISAHELSAEQTWLLSDLFFRLGKHSDSLSFLERYAERNPAEERVYFRRAQLYLALNDLDSALLHFQSARENTDRKAAASYGIGLVMFQKGELEKARDALMLCIQAEPKNPDFAHLLGTVLIDLGEPEEALQHLSRVEEQGEQFPKLYEAMARAYRKLRHAEKAGEYIQKFRQLDSSGREQRENEEKVRETLRQAQELMKTGKLLEGRRRLRDALQIDPENYLAHSYLAGISMTLGDWNLARQHLSRVEAINPDAFETKYMMASFLYQRGQPKEALDYAHKAKELQPGFADLRNLLGNIYYSLGSHEKALGEYEAAMKLEPGREEFRINYEAAARRARPQ